MYYCVISVITIVYIPAPISANNYSSVLVKGPLILTEKMRMANSGITLRLQPFNTYSNRTSVGQRWGMWLEEFEDELHLLRVTDNNAQTICLKRYDEREIWLIVKYLPSTEQNRNETYEEMKKKIKSPLHTETKQATSQIFVQ